MQLRKKDLPGLYAEIMIKQDISQPQAHAIFDNLGWGFNWQKHENIVVFSSIPDNKKQLNMFRENIQKYANVSNDIMEASTGHFMFAVSAEEVKNETS